MRDALQQFAGLLGLQPDAENISRLKIVHVELAVGKTIARGISEQSLPVGLPDDLACVPVVDHESSRVVGRRIHRRAKIVGRQETVFVLHPFQRNF